MDILTTLLFILPFAVLLWLANLADRQRSDGNASAGQLLGGVSLGLLAATYLLLMGTGLLLVVARAAMPAGSLQPVSGLDQERLPRLGLALAGPAVLGLLLLLKPVRAAFARLTDIKVDRTVHAMALSLSALVLVNMLVILAMGIRNLAQAIEESALLGTNYNPAPGIWAQNIAFLLLSVVGVGWLARKSIGAALHRLGIVAPRLGQIILGVVAGLVMVPLVLGLEWASGKLGLGTSADVERLSEQLIGPLTQSVPGVLTLGLAAALGEESLFRGAMQPRFGLLLTALLFALLHAQYGLSFSTVAVFLVGLVLGYLRLRHNTTTSMITHAVYNMSLGLISLLGLFENL